MKKIFLFLLFMTTMAHAQIVNIPDANFKAKLLSANTSPFGFPIAIDQNNNPIVIDVNGDFEIQQSEALLVYGLRVRASNINDLTGLDAFTNLTFLNFDFNPITTMDVDISAITNLQSISAYNCPQLVTFSTGTLPNLQSLNIFSNALTSLELSQFPSLTNLSVNNNQLTELDLSSVPNLTNLSVNNNQLTELDLSSVPNLESLYCYNNFLTALDLSNNPNLQNLGCHENLLTTLDLSFVPDLTSLSFGNAGFLPIDVNDLVNLTGLFFYGGTQTSIDVSNLINLQSFTFSNTNLISVDFSNNPNIMGELFFENNLNLEYINIKNGSNSEGPFFSGLHPSLTFVCADSDQVDAIQNSIGSSVVCSSYCTFTPGGDYNTITGSVIFDIANDGCDASDLPQNHIRIDINDGTNSGATFTNAAANYSFYTQAGNFIVTPNIENPEWFNFSPLSATIPFPNNNNNIVTQNFCLTVNGIHPDLEVVIAPIFPARPGFVARYVIVYKNKGNQVMSQLDGVGFSYNQDLMTFISATETPSTIVSGGFSWDFDNLMPFESRSIYVNMQINPPTNPTNPVNNGDILQFTSSIMPTTNDETPTDNLFQFNQTVIGSYDPNDITCLEGDVVGLNYIGEYLHYVINFENTGTAEAENVIVKVEINPNDFDINSLRILDSSHEATIRITNNKLEVIFQGIMLDSGGHGNILLKMATNPDLQINDFVQSKANIYFDYNFPILTNDATTTFAVLSAEDFDPINAFKVYPNPVEDKLFIQSVEVIKSVEVYDQSGRLIVVNMPNQAEIEMDLSHQASGVYFVKITTQSYTKTEKLIVK